MGEIIDAQHLPNDTQTLKTMVIELREELRKLQEEHRRTLKEGREAYEQLQEKFRILHRIYFGRSSEKLSEEDHRQGLLFK